MRVCCDLTIINAQGDYVFGPLEAKLCRGVLETRSLLQAARSIPISYSAAWNRKVTAEKKLGFKLTVRVGARSALTDEGVRLLEAYETTSIRCDRSAIKLWQIFED